MVRNRPRHLRRTDPPGRRAGTVSDAGPPRYSRRRHLSRARTEPNFAPSRLVVLPARDLNLHKQTLDLVGREEFLSRMLRIGRKARVVAASLLRVLRDRTTDGDSAHAGRCNPTSPGAPPGRMRGFLSERRSHTPITDSTDSPGPEASDLALRARVGLVRTPMDGIYNLCHVVPLQPKPEGSPDRLRCDLRPRPTGRHPKPAPPWRCSPASGAGRCDTSPRSTCGPSIPPRR